MSTKRQQRAARKRQAPKVRKPAITDPQKSGFTPRELGRLLAEAAIAFERIGESKKLEEVLDAVPDSVVALAALAGEPDHWLAREFSTPAIALSEAVSMLAARAEGLAQAAKAAKRGELEKKALRVLEELQQALSWMFRTVSLLARLHVLRTPTRSDLFVEVVGGALRSAEDLPKLFERFEQTADPEEFSEDGPDTLYFRLAEVVVDLVKHFEAMCERHPERFRYLARELPYWPALVTKHKAGYRKRFERIAGKGFLELGAECPLDPSARAMYRLETPVCGLLWEEVFRDWLAVSAEVRALRREARQRNQPVDPRQDGAAIESAVAHCCASDAERDIFRAAFALPELSKATANRWADRFVIPYLRLKLPQWQAVPALKNLVGKKRGATKAEREIRRAVGAMARG